MTSKWKAYLILTRPANLITAIADILAGVSFAGYWQFFYQNTPEEGNIFQIILLVISTLGLYGGGVVFNDVFDHELDKVERPERPIPSGKATLQGATVLGIILLGLGFASAFAVSSLSGWIAVATGLLAVFYDGVSKHSVWAGPLNMGLCRGGNLLLGVSIIPEMVPEVFFVACVPIMYIGAITLISQGEVHGGNRKYISLAFILYGLVVVFIIGMGLILPGYVLAAIPFLVFLLYRIIPPLTKAYQSLSAGDIFKAVKTGVLSLIVLDASLAAVASGWIWGIAVLLLLPVSQLIARQFAVT